MNTLGMKDELFIWWESFDDPYERLYTIASYVFHQNGEATFYDLFNYIREDIFKGWPYDEESKFIRDIDFDIWSKDGN